MPQQEHLDLLLLEFRKLREGIVSSHRTDKFAVEVYETSAELAILANNIPQITTILPHLVQALHPGIDSDDDPTTGASFENSLAGMSLSSKSDGSQQNIRIRRGRFLGYYLLHVLCQSGNHAGFQRLLQDLVSFETAAATAWPRMPSNNEHISWVLEFFRYHVRNDYHGLALLVSSRQKTYDKYAWMIIAPALVKLRSRVWMTMKASYLTVQDQPWLEKQLLLDQDKLHIFLQAENWLAHLKADGTISLKMPGVRNA